MQVKKLTEFAVIPARGSIDAAGFDLSSAVDIVVPKKGKAIVKTDIAIAIPVDTYARVAPRSGLAVKNFIDVGAGVVDYDYRGNVGVVLFNHADEDFTVNKGDRVAQLILERISMAAAQEVQELSETARGAGGFGSTGVEGAVTATSQGGAVIASTGTLGELVQVKKLTDLATLPTRGSVHAAGFDLSSAYDLVIPKHGKAIVKTDIAISIPEGTYARVAPRSGLAVKNFIDVGAGVVDYDYRGNVGVVLFNHADEDFTVQKGDRVAQLILERISMAAAEEVQELSDTARGAGGFGSTGVSA
eukprot:gene24329-27522_t